MILAAADYASNPSRGAPELLEEAFLFLRTRVPPTAGGLDDQPAGDVTKMLYLADVFNAVRARRQGGEPGAQAKWKKDNPETWEIIKQVRRLREHAHDNPRVAVGRQLRRPRGGGRP